MSIQVVDIQDATTKAPKLLLNSDKVLINLNNTIVNDLSISWDSNQACYRWNWGVESTDLYTYYVVAGIQASENEYVKETMFTDLLFYMPKHNGSILRFSVRAMRKPINEQEINVYSEEKVLDKIIDFELFGSGVGEINDPYIINTSEDFLNIDKRNVEGQKFYFKLAKDIELDYSQLFVEVEKNGVTSIKRVLESFYGQLDGDGHSIKYSISTLEAMGKYKAKFYGFTDVEFDKYASLFKTIASGAVVKNLKLDYTIQYDNLDSSNVIYAPLAMFNNGNITNVSIKNFEILKLNSSKPGLNNIVIAGIVGINNGRIEGCSNSVGNIDEFLLTLPQRISMNFAYAGITVYNDSRGEIINTTNQGSKKFIETVSNNSIYLAGLTITNAGKIKISGNDGDFLISTMGSAKSINAFAAGIALSNENGALEFIFNNGNLQKDNPNIILESAAISLTLNSGTLNTLIDTAGIVFFKDNYGEPLVKGTMYSKPGFGSGSPYVQTVQLEEKHIQCNLPGYKLAIIKIKDFEVRIIKGN